MTWLGYASVPLLQQEGGRESAGKARESVMNAESDSRLWWLRMSHLAWHCAVNETERGETPAERVREREGRKLYTRTKE